MSKFGEIVHCVVHTEQSTGRSPGFGFVIFSSAKEAENVLESEHILGGRILEVNVARPKEAMRSSGEKVTWISVRGIPPSVTQAMFYRYFEAYGEVTYLDMRKDKRSKTGRSFGFISFKSADSVDTVMAESHELGGSTIVVDHAYPKDEKSRSPSRLSQVGYGGASNAYASQAAQYAALGPPTLYDHPTSSYGRGVYESSRVMGKQIFVSRIPKEASDDDLQQYFGKFGHILNVSISKDPKQTTHRGFGFVTFAEDGAMDQVLQRTHEILGHEVAVTNMTPLDGAGPMHNNDVGAPPEAYGWYVDPMHNYGPFYGSLNFNDMSTTYGWYVGPMHNYGSPYGSLDFNGVSTTYGGYVGPMHNCGPLYGSFGYR